MILHLLRMRRNVNRNVFKDRKHVSATAYLILPGDIGCMFAERGKTCLIMSVISAWLHMISVFGMTSDLLSV